MSERRSSGLGLVRLDTPRVLKMQAKQRTGRNRSGNVAWLANVLFSGDSGRKGGETGGREVGV